MPTATISAGKLRHRVTLEYATETRNARTNELEETWQQHAVVWGSVEPIAGNERFSSMQIQGDITHLVTVRSANMTTAKAKWRVKHDGRTLYLEGPPVDIEERGRKTILMCRERAD